MLGLALLSSPALAQQTDPVPGAVSPPPASDTAVTASATREAAAQALFDEAVKLMEQRRYPEACERFASSQRLDPGAGTLLNLGTCYEKNHQSASAWATFVEAATVAAKGGHADWAERAQARATALEPSLARVTVVVPPDSAVEGLVVERDTLRVDAGSYGAAIPVDPGQYTFSASAPGRKGWSTTVTAEGGKSASVTIPELEKLPPPPPVVAMPAPLAATSFWSTGRVAGVAVGAVGIVGVVVGSLLGLDAKSDYDNARANDCPNKGTSCSPAGVALGQSASSLAIGSTVAFVLAGAALAGSVTLLVVARPHAQEASLRLVPMVGVRTGGAGLEATW